VRARACIFAEKRRNSRNKKERYKL